MRLLGVEGSDAAVVGQLLEIGSGVGEVEKQDRVALMEAVAGMGVDVDYTRGDRRDDDFLECGSDASRAGYGGFERLDLGGAYLDIGELHARIDQAEAHGHAYAYHRRHAAPDQGLARGRLAAFGFWYFSIHDEMSGQFAKNSVNNRAEKSEA